MRISCVLNLGQLASEKPDLIVFPEGISRAELHNAGSAYSDSIVVGAFDENRQSRGLLLHRGRSWIDYVKVGTDYGTNGSGNLQQRPVFELGDVCVGVLICMDVDHVEFSKAVIGRIKSSHAGVKLICVSADMGPHWFDGEAFLGQKFEGVHVVLCNHTRTYGEVRCKSFITDTHCKKIATQKHDEALHIKLPYSMVPNV